MGGGFFITLLIYSTVRKGHKENPEPVNGDYSIKGPPSLYPKSIPPKSITENLWAGRLLPKHIWTVYKQPGLKEDHKFVTGL